VRLVRWASAICAEEGFAVNPAKTRVMTAGRRQEVTGIVVNRQPNLARQAYDQLKATLTNCLRHGPETQALGVPHFRDHLRGKIAWLTQLHPARGARLLALFEQIRF
jgi:hypothetical protein